MPYLKSPHQRDFFDDDNHIYFIANSLVARDVNLKYNEDHNLDYNNYSVHVEGIIGSSLTYIADALNGRNTYHTARALRQATKKRPMYKLEVVYQSHPYLLSQRLS